MRFERPRLQLRMILHTDKPGMVRNLDGFRQNAVRRRSGEDQTAFLELLPIADIDFVAVPVPLGNACGAP